jgi:Pathogenicity locus
MQIAQGFKSNSDKSEKNRILKELQTIPSIGKACALDLWNIGIRSIGDLEGQNPKKLYEKLNRITGIKHDICMLYTFRCAVYFATESHHEREKLNWWYWKDKSFKED